MSYCNEDLHEAFEIENVIICPFCDKQLNDMSPKNTYVVKI